MARGDTRRDTWWREAPAGAWVLIAICLVAIAVMTPFALDRSAPPASADPLPTLPADEAVAPVALPASVDSLVVIGDSYAEGAGAGAEGSYAEQLAVLMGWPEPDVLSVSGGGYLSPGPVDAGPFSTLLGQAQAPAPDVVVVQGGRNDYEYNEIAPAAREFLMAVHERWPDAVLVVPGILWPSPAPDAVVESNSEIIQAASSVGYALPVDLIGTGLVYELGPDGVHPTAEGHRQIAEAIREALAG